MLIADILKLPGEVSQELPHGLLSKIVGYYSGPETVPGATYKTFCRHPADACGKGGREVGALYAGDRAVLFCLCRGKYSDEWEIHVLDRAAYVALYVQILEQGGDIEVCPPESTDVRNSLNYQDMEMLLRAGYRDSRPPPDRAESYDHLCHLLHLRAMQEGTQVCALNDPRLPCGFIARPAEFARRVCADLRNAHLEPFNDEHFQGVRITLRDEETPA